MNKCLLVGLMALCMLGLAACTNKQTLKQEDQKYQRKIYLTEDDYMEDLDKEAYKERREAKPNTESEYIFALQPETQKNVYFFDERTRPMVPGVPSERDYKNTKRLWQKPKRYSPEQYYGDQAPAAAQQDDSSDESADYSSYNDEYDY